MTNKSSILDVEILTIPLFLWIPFIFALIMVICIIYITLYPRKISRHIYCQNHGGAISVASNKNGTTVLCADSTLE